VTEHSGSESVLSRAVRIQETLTPEQPALTVSEIAGRSGLHVATASRLIAALAGHPWPFLAALTSSSRNPQFTSESLQRSITGPNGASGMGFSRRVVSAHASI